MPIYEYECPTCGRFETIQKADDKPLKSCPQCAEKGKKNAVQRVVSPAAFHLKGSGWYKTDYSSGSSKSGKSSGGETKSSSSKSSDSSGSGGSSGGSSGGCGGGACGCH